MSRFTTSTAVAALTIALSLFAGLVSTAARAQAYPSKPVRLIVPFAAGGPADFAARTVGQALSKSFGQPFVVENRPGADGAIAAQTVLSASPDGYTLLFSGASMVPLSLLKNPPPFDLITDFAPVAKITRLVWAMYVSPDAPARSVAEFIAYARANPDKLNYASSNFSEFLAATQFMNATGTKMVGVPYKGGAQSMPDLVAGRVQVNFAPLSAGLPYVRDGRLRMLAILLPQRSPLVPDVPTMAEAGVPGISVPGWQAILAPAKTPKEIIDRLFREIDRTLQSLEVRAQFDRQAVQVEGSTPEALAAVIEEDLRTWRQFIRENGLTPE